MNRKAVLPLIAQAEPHARPLKAIVDPAPRAIFLLARLKKVDLIIKAELSVKRSHDF